jgi:hypothetical protein
LKKLRNTINRRLDGIQMAKKGKKIGRLDRNKWVVIKD